MLEEILNSIKFVKIQGSINSRNNKITDFKSKKTSVIFLNSDYDGSGLNLQEATDIILFHEMNEATKTQIIGRARRIGRKSQLRVHQLKVNI